MISYWLEPSLPSCSVCAAAAASAPSYHEALAPWGHPLGTGETCWWKWNANLRGQDFSSLPKSWMIFSQAWKYIVLCWSILFPLYWISFFKFPSRWYRNPQWATIEGAAADSFLHFARLLVQHPAPNRGLLGRSTNALSFFPCSVCLTWALHIIWRAINTITSDLRYYIWCIRVRRHISYHV